MALEQRTSQLAACNGVAVNAATVSSARIIAFFKMRAGVPSFEEPARISKPLQLASGRSPAGLEGADSMAGAPHLGMVFRPSAAPRSTAAWQPRIRRTAVLCIAGAAWFWPPERTHAASSGAGAGQGPPGRLSPCVRRWPNAGGWPATRHRTRARARPPRSARRRSGAARRGAWCRCTGSRRRR